MAFREWAVRLSKDKWPTAQRLAEELLACFASEDELTVDNPVTFIQQSGQPPVRVVAKDPDPNSPAIQVFRPDPATGDSGFNGGDITTGGTTITNGPGGAGGGGPDLQGITWPDNPDPNNVPKPAETPIVLWGRVASGSGDGYLVNVWGKPPSSTGPMGTLFVNVGQIDPSETIPAGTAVLVVAFPAVAADGSIAILEAWMQPPVWLPGTA